jgi:hypothetical protein
MLQQACTFKKALRKVDLITDKLGKPVDKKIRNLLASMIMMGIRTTGSCGGHMTKKGHGYPWIEFDARNIHTVKKILGHQNRLRKDNGLYNHNKWVILPGGRPWIVPWDTRMSLKTLQQYAEEFASRIQMVYTRRNY